MYSCYELTEESKTKLLEAFPPKYETVLCDHITYKFPVHNISDLPPMVGIIEVIGYATVYGLEAFIVKLDGMPFKDGGGKYHITHSLIPSMYRPVDSNKIIMSRKTEITPIHIVIDAIPMVK